MNNKLKTLTTKQSFYDIRKQDLFYIDKTKQIYNLITSQGDIFLKRPRRFGKSLLISTLYELFSGNQELFNGLYIKEETNYTFDDFPIIYISFANYNNKEHNDKIQYFLDQNIKITYKGIIYNRHNFNIQTNALGELTKKIHNRLGKKVVVLVDEYDKMATTNFNNQEDIDSYISLLSGLYSGIKDSNAEGHIHFTLISGLTKILSNDLFSTLNHLNDIDTIPSFYDICGYTHKEILDNFNQHEDDYLALLAKNNANSIDDEMSEIKDFYNGYNFGNTKDLIYNPYSVNILMQSQEYGYYWANTGRAQLVIDYLYGIDKLEYLDFIDSVRRGNEYVFGNSELFSLNKKQLNLKGLLYQSGYLTKYNKKYRIPNKETEFCLVEDFTNITFDYNRVLIDKFTKSGMFFIDGVFKNNKDKLKTSLDNIASILQNINPKWSYNNPEGQFKGYLYNAILMSGLDKYKFLSQEEITNDGYSDITIKDNLNNTILIIEAKGSESIKGALTQIRNQYLDYYNNLGYKIIIMGLKWDIKKSVITYTLSNEFDT